HATTPRPPHSPLFPYTTLFRSPSRNCPTARSQEPSLDRPWPSIPPPGAYWSRSICPIQAMFCVQEPLPRSRSTCARFPMPLRCRSEEHTSELQSLTNLVCRLLL